MSVENVGTFSNGRPSYTVSKQSNECPTQNTLPKSKIASDITKKKFAKVYGGEIKVAPKPKNELETNQEKIWRHLVVRASGDKNWYPSRP